VTDSDRSAILRDSWNQGLATEIAQISLEFGFGHLGLPEIASWALPTNVASQRVMEKVGFRYQRDLDFAGQTHRFYRLAKGEWRGYSMNHVIAYHLLASELQAHRDSSKRKSDVCSVATK
jgi:hypothetical protein